MFSWNFFNKYRKSLKFQILLFIRSIFPMHASIFCFVMDYMVPNVKANWSEKYGSSCLKIVFVVIIKNTFSLLTCFLKISCQFFLNLLFIYIYIVMKNRFLICLCKIHFQKKYFNTCIIFYIIIICLDYVVFLITIEFL